MVLQIIKMQPQPESELLKLNSDEQNNFIDCVCSNKVKKEDWQDHQIICVKRRLSCPAFVSFLSESVKFERPLWKIFGARYADLSLSLVDSNCAPSLKEIAKEQVLRSKYNLSSMKSNKIPSAIIHTLRWECPTFSTKNELNKHMTESCPYYKVHCSLIPRHVCYDVIPTNCHSNYKCPKHGLSRQEFHEHSMKGKLDPISQRLKPKSIFFPYHCLACDQHLPNSNTHICIESLPDLPSPPLPASEIICHGCKSILTNPNKSFLEIHNACQFCCRQKKNPIVIGLLGMIPQKHQNSKIFWDEGMVKCKVHWKDVKEDLIHRFDNNK
ncbi:hypothetical protein Glove_353g9 [Diversispora epigaea]|uniref:Uncharacterized protein n=1 Tax=Diversispora epigaea TaxID=1348612 RepID=A0A397HEF2_9GLOM|nr:hypothetical protein Glove_353g9 [Diversispora epigaea]